ncbi:hypothetical protein [Pseudoalteromonas gelatinilytica]|uniref:Uncharacterized protein n=1 Tax=Pseudoalteromonas gelatinilytica TaxID=1703256 RepID=A0ABQ1TR89_9GAMM|nr:hypothetical protein [Pseudoalteromonas profundi]GGF00514.1 hypothetical protein GCM10008027_26690 [Pseudoalteromonas profundi]
MSNFKLQFVTLFGYDYAKGAKELGVSERQVRRYLKANKATKPIEKLVEIMYRGYMPLTGPWSECRISREDNLLLTPWGKVKPSDVQLVHRYKWSAKKSEQMYQNLKKQTSTQDKYLFDLQNQLLDIIGDISERTGS